MHDLLKRVDGGGEKHLPPAILGYAIYCGLPYKKQITPANEEAAGCGGLQSALGMPVPSVCAPAKN